MCNTLFTSIVSLYFHLWLKINSTTNTRYKVGAKLNDGTIPICGGLVFGQLRPLYFLTRLTLLSFNNSGLFNFYLVEWVKFKLLGKPD